MATKENIMHDLLLIITTALFILFATGLSEPLTIEENEEPLIIPG